MTLERAGGYRLLERIGAESIGESYRARDTRSGRTAAVTVLSQDVADDPIRRASVLDAARQCLALSHPNIAAIYEVGDGPGPPFVAREFVDGETLRHTIAGRPLHLRSALDLGAQMAGAIAEAHAHGLAHGHLTSDAVVITPKGRVKIVGFGAPSEIVNSDAATDLGALGRVLVEMLTGSGDSVSPVDVADSVAPLSRLVDAQVPDRVRAAVAGLLKPAVAVRNQAAQAAAALRASMAEVKDDAKDEVQTGSTAGLRTFKWRYVGWLAAVGGLVTIGWLLLR